MRTVGEKNGHLALLMTVLMVMSVFIPAAQALAPMAIEPSAPADAPISDINGVAKDMTFYLHYVNDTETSKTIIDKSTWYYLDTSQEWNDNTVALRVSAAQQIFKWYVSPVLTDDFTVNSFDLIIWAQRIGGAGNPNKVVKIYEKDKDGETLVHTKNHGAGPGIVVAPTEQTWGSDAAWGGHTFKKGNSIIISLELNPGAGNTFDFLFDTATYDSRVVFDSPDSMNVTAVELLDHEDNSRRNLDPTALNKTVRLRANVTDLFGGYDIKWVNLTLMDPIGGTILDNVSMNKVLGNPTTFLNIYEVEWNYSGQMAGQYNVTVWALDNNGYFYRFYDGNADFGNYYVEFQWDFSIGEVTFLNIKVLDSKDIPLDGATVIAALNDTKIIEGSGLTNASGMINLTMFSAEYEIRVYWAETLVAEVVYDLVADVNETSPLEVVTAVYYPNFRFKDGHNLPLENATVTIIYPNGTTSQPFRSNATGEFDLDQVPGGAYWLHVRWRDVEVNSTIIDVINNTNHTIMTFVHYMTVIARDDLGGILPGAQIVIANNTTTIVFDSKVTNLTGTILSRLPAGPYDLTIYWQNSMVFERTNISFYSDMTIDAYTGIFVLNITALDGHLVPVSKARILVMTTSQSVIESNFTDNDGLVKSRLPRGTHLVQAYWRDILVNETQVDLDTNHDITLALDINYPTIQVVDDEGSPLTNARVDLIYTGTTKLFGSSITDQLGQIMMRAPNTGYDINVIWLDRLVNETVDLVLDSDDTYVIVASVYSLGLRIEDPHGLAVDNALVEVSFSDSELVGVYTTDQNGSTSVMLPTGQFDIAVYWHSVLVKEEIRYLLVMGAVETLVVDIWYINITALDSSGLNLENALISLAFTGSGARFDAFATGDTGNTIIRLPGEVYDITVSWMDHIVFNGSGYGFSADQDLVLDCMVYYLTIRVVDSKGIDVVDSAVSVMYATDLGPVTTETYTVLGPIDLRLPSDQYIVEATWNGVVINTTDQFGLDDDLDLVLDASVHYLTMTLLDSRDVPLIGVSVSAFIAASNLEISNGVTDGDGVTVLRIPGHVPLNLTARWVGIQVLHQTAYTVQSDHTETFHADVYYLELELLDTQNYPVETARVVAKLRDNGLVFATGTTTANGTVEFRLPATGYSIEAVWWGVRIYQQDMDVIGDDERTCPVSVSYLTLEVLDSRDGPVTDAWVNLALGSTGSTFGAGVTDGNGTLSSRLPHESYSMIVYWMGIRVATEPSIELDGDMTWTVDANVFYLDVRVVDDRSTPVEDALVTIVMTSNGSIAKACGTSAGGEATFRLPVGVYDIDVDWKAVVVAQDLLVDLQKDEALTINARVFYLSYKGKDSTGAPMKGIRIRVLDQGGNMMAETETDSKGKAEFRLPVGSYTMESRFVTTYMMSPVDLEKTSEVSLTSSVEHVETFSEYPTPIHETGTFLVAILSTLLIVILVLVIVLGLRRKKATAHLGEYPPEGEEPSDDELDDVQEEEEADTEAPEEDEDTEPGAKTDEEGVDE